MEKVMMKLAGITCHSFLTMIEKEVHYLDGNDQIKVMFNAGKLKFTMDPDKVKAVDVKAAIEKMGYEVQGIKEKELN